MSKDDFCLVGSMSLSMLGIRPHGDVDICVRENMKPVLSQHKTGNYLSEKVNLVINKYVPLGISDEQLVDNPDHYFKVDGFKVIRPEIEFSIKIYRQREKDKKDIPLIEAYALQAQDWDWEKVRIVPRTPKSTKKKVSQNIAPPQIKVSQLIKYPRKALKQFYEELKLFKKANNARTKTVPLQPQHDIPSVEETVKHLDSRMYEELMLQYPTVSLVAMQRQASGLFNRLDIIVRYMAIEHYWGQNNNGWDLYRKMQTLRGKRKDIEACVKNFESLIQSVLSKGFFPSSTVFIKADGTLLDGAHRLATALYYQEKTLSVLYQSTNIEIDYSYNWFKRVGFTEEELVQIQAKKEELFFKHGLFFPVILWPPAQPFFDEITRQITSEYPVHAIYQLNLEDQGFQDLLRSVYAIDDVDQWKIEKKLSGMKNYPKQIQVLALELYQPHFRPKARTQDILSDTGAALKKQYRTAFKDRVPDYFYDIILHTGDNYHHNACIWDIISRYQPQHLPLTGLDSLTQVAEAKG